MLDANLPGEYPQIGQFHIGSLASGAGLEIDCEGNLWAVDQNDGMIYQAKSGEMAYLCERDAVPWLAEDPITGTVVPSGTQTVDVGWWANVAEVDQPGTYCAGLKIKNNDPNNQNLVLPVTMTVTPPPAYGKLVGVVSSTGHCDANPHSIEGAQVYLEGGGYTFTLETNASGHYQRWLGEAESPYTVTVSYAEHPTTAATAAIVAGATTTQNFTLRWQQPCVSVTMPPAGISATLDMGLSTTLQMSISNSGATSLEFELQERNRGFQIAALLEGTIIWLTRSTEGIPVAASDSGSTVAYPGSYRYVPATSGPAAINILVYADDWIHPAPNTLVQQAITRLGLPATVHVDDDYAGFETDLSTGGPWDLVIWSGENYSVPDTTLDALLNYLQNGGKLAATYWQQLNIPTDPLWAEMGFTYIENYVVPPPAYWWDPGHPIFNDPESAPEWINRVQNSGTSQGTKIAPLASGVAVAGYTTTPAPSEAGIVIRDDDMAIYKGLRDVSTDVDDDGDGALDGVELWENIITGLLYGFGGDVSWLSEDPITGTVPSDDGLAPIDVTLDAAYVAQPGEYHATLNVNSNDPINSRIGIPVTVTVNVPATWGKLQGIVTSLSHCDANPAPLEDAEVLLAGGTTVSVTTDVSGTYAYWLEEGTYLVIVSADEHLSNIAMVNVTAGTTTTQDFDLRWLQPCVDVAPPTISATLDMGVSTTLPMSISNSGAAALEFEVDEADRGFVPLAATFRPLAPPPDYVGLNSDQASEFPVVPTAPWQLLGTGALLIQDSAAWGYNAIETILINNSIPYDVINSSQIATTNFTPYKMIIIPSVQGSTYNAEFNANLAKFENFINAGGVVLMSFCEFSGDIPYRAIPFGGISNYGTASDNYIVEPDHPIFAGVPNPYWGSAASHSYLTDLLPDDRMLVTAGTGPGGNVVMIERDHGAGMLVAGGQTFEFGWGNGQGAGIILENMIPHYYFNWEGGGDVPWLSEDPITGTVPADGGLIPIDVTLDAAYVAQPGEYHATLNVNNNDPVSGSVSIPVTMTANLPATYGKLQGTVTSLGYCDVNTTTLEGAQVQIEGHPLILTTDVSGTYVLWLDQGTYTVTVSAAEHQTDTAVVVVTAQTTTTHDVDLRWLQPCVDVTPPSISATLDMGLSTTLSLTLTNGGAAALGFEFSERSGEFTPLGGAPLHAGGQVHTVSDSKDEPPAEAVPGASLPLASGGPDPFGYVFKDSNELGGPTYEWIEIAPPAGGSGIPVGLNDVDDGYFWPVALLFAFNFYGTDYTELAIASNGTVYFEDIFLGLSNTPIPGSNGYGVNTFIAHLWDDLYVTPGEVYYLAQDDVFIIEYYQVSGCCISPDSATWEVILFANGSILFQYQDATFGDLRDYGGEATVGIQGDTVTGLQYSYNAPALSDDLAICFAYPGESPDCSFGDVPWLTEEPITGTVPAYSTMPITITFDASQVSQPGVYQADLRVSSNDPYSPTVDVPVTMTVEPDPNMGKLRGTVTADQPAGPLEGALVEVISGATTVISGTTDGSGGYGPWWLTNGVYSVTVSAAGYFPDQQTMTITAGMTTTHDVVLLSSYVPGTVAYVTLSDSNLVALVDTASHTVMGTVNVGAVGCYFPWRATMSPDWDYVYVGCRDSDNVAVIETAGNTVVTTVGGIPSADGIAFTRDGAYALVGSMWNNQIAVVDTTAYVVTRTIPTPNVPRSVAVHPHLDRAYATCGDGSIQVIDTTDFSIVKAIPVGGDPRDVALSPDGRWVFVSDRGGAGPKVIAAGSNTVHTTVTGLGGLQGLAVTPDGSRVYAADRWGDVHVIDGATFSYLTSIPGASDGWDVAVTCDGSELYVTRGSSGDQVPVVDTATSVVTDTIDMPGSGPRGIAICPQFRLAGLYLYPTAQSGYDAPGRRVVYEEILANDTGQMDSFDLSLVENVWDTDISLTNTGPLTDGAWITFTVHVTIPVWASPGDADAAAIQATSVTSPTVYTSTATITTTAICTPNLTFTGQSAQTEGDLDDIYSGGKFIYAYVYGYSSDSDTLDATISGYDPGSGTWQIIAQQWGGGNGAIADQFLIPPTYTRVRVQLDDTEDNDEIYYDYKFIICREPMVDLSPPSQQGFAQPGTTAVYTQMVTNYMMTSDSFDLSASGNSWPTTFWDDGTQISNTGSLADLEIFTFTVKMEAPASVGIGDSDAATIRARSVASPAISDTASLRTTVLAHPWVQAFSDYWAPNGSTDRDQYLDIVRSSGIVTAQVTDDWDWQDGPPAVAAYPRDAIVAAWTGPYRWNGTVSYYNVEYAAYDTDGHTVIPITQVSDNISVTVYTYDYNPAPAVAPTDGNVLVAWCRYQDDWPDYWYNVYYAVRGPAGTEVLSPTALTTNITSTVRDYYPSAAAFDDGHFAVAWRHWDDATGADDIYYAVLDSAGGLLVGPVNLTNNIWEDDYEPRANRLSDGNVLLTWHGYHGSGNEIYYAVLDSAGNVVYPVTRLTDVPHSAYYPDAVGLRNGNAVVAWEQYGYYPNWGLQIAYTVLDSAYTPTTTVMILTNTLSNDNHYVSLARDSDDNAVFTWRDDGSQHIYYAVVDNTDGVRTWPLVFRTARDSQLDISWWGAGNGSLPVPLLTLDKVAAPDPVETGGTLVYTLTYGNAGSSSASGVVLTETYDANVTFLGTDPPPDVGNNVWNIGALPNGIIGTVVITVQVASPLPDGTLLHNQAALDAPDIEAAVATADTVVTSAPVWTLVKSDAPDPVEADELLVYTIAYGNSGNEDATGVVITETYDGNVTFVSADPAPTSGDNVWNIGPADVGLSDNIVVTVEVASPLPDGTLLTNWVMLDSDQSGPVERIITTTVTSTPVWTLTKSDSADPVPAGSTLVYTVGYGNVGNDGATGVSLVETYPPQVTFVAADPAPSLGNAVWNIGPLDAGVMGTVVITVEVDTPLPNGAVLTNTVTIAGNKAPPLSVDETTLVQASTPALSISKMVGPDPVAAGGLLIYTITVENTGNADATGVTISDTIPTNTIFAWTDSGGALVGDRAQWTGKVVDAGGSLTVTFAVTVTSPLPSGTIIANADYGATCAEGMSAAGSSVITTVSTDEGWIIYLPLVTRNR